MMRFVEEGNLPVVRCLLVNSKNRELVKSDKIIDGRVTP